LDCRVPGSAGVVITAATTNMRAKAMTGTVPLLLVALALLLRPASAGASISVHAHGDDGHRDRGPAGPGRAPSAVRADLAVAAGAGAGAAPTRSLGDDPSRSTLLARGRETTARAHAAAAGTNGKTPCRLGRARVGATLQVWDLSTRACVFVRE